MVVWAYTTAYPKGQDGDTAPTPSDIATELRGITDAHPFQGISGRIAFDGKGAPTKRALIVKTIQESTNTDANGNHLLTWKEEQVVGQFCATDSCTPTY